MTLDEECRLYGHAWIVSGDLWASEYEPEMPDPPPDVFITDAGSDDHRVGMTGYANASAICYRCSARQDPKQLRDPAACAASYLAAVLVCEATRGDEHQADTSMLVETIARELLVTALTGVISRATVVRGEYARKREERMARHEEWLRGQEGKR